MGRLGGISSSSSSHSRKSPRIQPPCPHAPRVLFAPITSPPFASSDRLLATREGHHPLPRGASV
jgi:hypothetical protein